MTAAQLLLAAALACVARATETERKPGPGGGETGGESPGAWPTRVTAQTAAFEPLALREGAGDEVGAAEVLSETWGEIVGNRGKANSSQDVSEDVSAMDGAESGSSSSESEEAPTAATESSTTSAGVVADYDTAIAGDSRETWVVTESDGENRTANVTAENSESTSSAATEASSSTPGSDGGGAPGAADDGGEKEEEEEEEEVLGPGDEPGPPQCLQLLKTPTPPFNMTFFTGTEGQDYANWYTDAEGGYRLRNTVRVHTITAVRETRRRSALCVSLVDTTSYTQPARPGRGEVAWATLHVRPEVPVGLLLVDSDCWRNENQLHSSRPSSLPGVCRNVAGCRPELRPLDPLSRLPLYRHSPLERAFWAGLQASLLGFDSDWVWRINTMTTSAAPRRVEADWLSLADLPELNSLEVQGNRWGRPPHLLPPLPRLVKLDLSYNWLQALPNGTLLQVPRLEEVILGHNDVSEFPREVARLPRLWLIDLTNPLGASPLRIADADIAALPPALDTVGLENTRLSANATALLLRPRLRFLNLSGCALPDLGSPPSDGSPAPASPLAVETLDLSSNRLRSLPAKLLSRMHVLKTLLLRNNSLVSWPEGLFGKNALDNLDLSDNLIANLSAGAFSSLDRVTTLDLSGNQLEYLPPSVFSAMVSLKWLYLSGNKLTQLPDELFSYNLKLTYLVLSKNQITTAPKTRNLNMKTLDLSHNNLERFSDSDTKIEILDLSFNAVASLRTTNVRRVNLSHNGLQFLDEALWQGLQPTQQVDLGGNDFQCCRFQDAALLARAADRRVRNLGTGEPLTCSVAGAGAAAAKILLTTFVYEGTAECGPRAGAGGGPGGEGGARGERASVQVGVQVALALLAAAAVALAVLLYVYRFELTYVRHLFRLKQAGAAADEQRYKTCVYDAFICYSAHNFRWVVETLVPTLEEGSEGYRLCLHDRDFALGAGINSNIVASLEKSRKVIFVLSQDFIASKWCQWELEMANHKMFEEKRNYIILVELERIPRRSLPRHLRYLMDRTTYLEWPAGQAAADPRRLTACFRRLRHALGDSLRKRTGQPGSRAATVLDA